MAPASGASCDGDVDLGQRVQQQIDVLLFGFFFRREGAIDHGAQGLIVAGRFVDQRVIASERRERWFHDLSKQIAGLGRIERQHVPHSAALER